MAKVVSSPVDTVLAREPVDLLNFCELEDSSFLGLEDLASGEKIALASSSDDESSVQSTPSAVSQSLCFEAFTLLELEVRVSKFSSATTTRYDFYFWFCSYRGAISSASIIHQSLFVFMVWVEHEMLLDFVISCTK